MSRELLAPTKESERQAATEAINLLANSFYWEEAKDIIVRVLFPIAQDVGTLFGLRPFRNAQSMAEVGILKRITFLQWRSTAASVCFIVEMAASSETAPVCCYPGWILKSGFSEDLITGRTPEELRDVVLTYSEAVRTALTERLIDAGYKPKSATVALRRRATTRATPR